MKLFIVTAFITRDVNLFASPDVDRMIRHTKVRSEMFNVHIFSSEDLSGGDTSETKSIILKCILE
jgi:hypothetical protein